VYQQLVPILFPVFAAALLGFGWARAGWPFQREFVTSLVMNVGAPCLILQGVAGLAPAQTGQFMQLVLIGVLAHLSCAIVGALALRSLRQPMRSFLPPLVFGNAGNLGLPLCLLAFGQEGLGLAVAIYLVGSVSQFILAPLFQGRQPVWRTLVQTPIIYAAIVGLGLLATDTAMPTWMATTVQLLSGLAIPLMLMALGHALGSFGIRNPGVAASLALGRLSLGFAVGWILTVLFHLEGVPRGVVLVETAMPVAIFNYLLAARYARHPETVAAAIVISTLVSFLTLPVLLLFALPPS